MTNQKEIMLTKITYKLKGEKKRSKCALNKCALKFKLKNLKSKTIRYEVIYKNLLRDIRKYLIQEFNKVTDYVNIKRKSRTTYPHHFEDSLKMFIL